MTPLDSRHPAAVDDFGLVGETVAGRFVVEELVAEGGFGVVYRAGQVGLERAVALKVLKAPEADSRSAARFHESFEAEARTIARLAHPNIVAVYDFGVWQRPGGAPVHWIAFEWLEGRTLEAVLAERRARGEPPHAPAAALALLRPVISAVAVAHQRGVVHRDLKPANIFLQDQPDGPVPRILDFGIARMVRPDEAVAAAGATTRSIPAFSPDYAAPEQVAQARTGPFTDVHALALIMTELLTGRPPYDGALDQAGIQGRFEAVLSLRRPTPGSKGVGVGAWESVLARALSRSAAERQPDAGRLLTELEGTIPVTGAADVKAERRARSRVSKGSRRIKRTAMVLIGLSAAAGLMYWGLRSEATAPRGEVVRFSLYPPDNTMLWNSVDLSSDGKRILFGTSRLDGMPLLWVRTLDSVTARPLPGTDLPRLWFWAPDGREVAFVSHGELKVIDLGSNTIRVLSTAVTTIGDSGSWNDHGDILISAVNGPIQRVPASGGSPVPATTVDTAAGETSHRWPSFLPDGRRFLFVAEAKSGRRTAFLGSLGSTQVRAIGPVDGPARYGPPGFLLFLRGKALVGQRFDAETAQVSGVAFQVSEEGAVLETRRFFSVSSTGVLGYRATPAQPSEQLVWYDRTGRRLGVLGEPGQFRDPALSPDGRRLVVCRLAPSAMTFDLWDFDLQRGSGTRVTFDAADEVQPVFLPGGDEILFASSRRKTMDTYRKALADVGEGELVLAGEQSVALPEDVSPDGRHFLYNTGGVSADVWLASLNGSAKPRPFLVRQFVDHELDISPDGRWVAFMSTESGRREIYVTDFPDQRRKWQISTEGGVEPRWRADGRELFFLSGNRKLMVAAIRPELPGFRAEPPRVLFEVTLNHRLYDRNRYVPSKDGQRFLVITPMEPPVDPPITIVVNWQSLAPTESAGR